MKIFFLLFGLLSFNSFAMVERPACIVCKKECEMRCSVCQKVYYCSKEHQKENWPSHKQYCKEMSLISPIRPMSTEDKNTCIQAALNRIRKVSTKEAFTESLSKFNSPSKAYLWALFMRAGYYFPINEDLIVPNLINKFGKLGESPVFEVFVRLSFNVEKFIKVIHEAGPYAKFDFIMSNSLPSRLMDDEIYYIKQSASNNLDMICLEIMLGSINDVLPSLLTRSISEEKIWQKYVNFRNRDVAFDEFNKSLMEDYRRSL